MADAKITALTELTTPADTDLLAIVDDPSGSAVTKKITRGKLNLLKQATVTLTNAQIRAWADFVPVEVVPAPAATKLLRFREATVIADVSGGDYTNIDANAYIVFHYDDANGFECSASLVTVEVANLLTSAGGTIAQFAEFGRVDAGWGTSLQGCLFPATSLGKNIAIAMFNGSSGNVLGGNAANSLTATVTYQVWNSVTGEYE